MENVEMTPVDMTPVAAEPPKMNPLGAVRKPTALKLPPKPTLAPGLKLPAKPVIRKPGSIAAPRALPKPIVPVAKPSDAPAPAASAASKPMEQLKTVTQKLKGITQEIPQQAILHKTGIIGDVEASAAQKEAAKHKTARISLSDAMGVAPVKSENAPMKTIRIKRPVGIASGAAPAAAPVAPATSAPTPEESGEATITQRKTLKIARPGGVVRPTGKFALKSPGEAAADAGGEDIPDIPDLAATPRVPVAVKGEADAPQWVETLSLAVQFAACVAIGALAFFLYQNTATLYF